MDHLSLTPATQAVLDALTDLGEGTVHEVADKSGKARSTTDKALRTLADAGLVVPVNADADSADGIPARWTLVTPVDASGTTPDDVSPGDMHTASKGTPEDADPSPDTGPGEPDTASVDLPAPPTDPDVNAEPGQDDETHRAEGTDPEPDPGEPGAGHDDGGSTGLDEGSGDAKEDGGEGGDADTTDEAARRVAVMQPARPGDRKVMAIKGVLADHGDDGATLEVIVAESGIGQTTATRLLTAMEQADAARRLPGLPQRWIPGPTKASEVDPNPQPPRCPLCRQVIRALATAPTAIAAVQSLIRPDGTLHIVDADGETHVVTLPTRTPSPLAGVARTTIPRSGDGSVNADGSQPFGRGELERLTLEHLAAHPGTAMTPQDIATALAAQLDRAVSNGAVRNNLTKAAAAGRILLVSDAPLTFAHPAPADTGQTDDSDQS
ncbi:helix-turn-helix domain-containing protein [Micromonospora sp. NPDC051196]|uniref:helix-turn-helix domain-containing protein n=1 Tax=Micromonospora sp. NPDC051196 TaxID=3155281 RepID=UPI003442EB00